MIKDVCPIWFDLGLELIEPGDEDWLYDIKTDNCNDGNVCCKEMFWFWLNQYPDASWNQLIQALKEPHIQLHDLASRVEAMLLPMDETIKGKLHICISEPRHNYYMYGL